MNEWMSMFTRLGHDEGDVASEMSQFFFSLHLQSFAVSHFEGPELSDLYPSW